MKIIPGKVHKNFVSDSGKQVIIRWPKADDAVALTDFVNELSQNDTFVSFGPDDVMTLEKESEFLLNVLTDGTGSFLIAEIDGKIISTAGPRRDTHGKSRTKHVATFAIAILEGYRHEGIGNEIMITSIDHAKNLMEGIKLLTLQVFANNTAAINLYKKHGFVKTGTIPNGLFYHGEYYDHDIMVKEL